MPPTHPAERNVLRPEDEQRSPRVDRLVARIARRQHGMIAVAQLAALGLSKDEIHHRAMAGRLIRVHRGVYAVGHLPSSPESRWMAAVLAVGAGGALSHDSAAMLWGIRDRGPGLVHVSAPDRRRSRPRIDLHRGLDGRTVTVRRGIPVTTPLRTLLDLATRPLTDRELARAIHEAQVQELVTHEELVAAVAARQGQRGNGRLRRILDAGPARTRSDLEELALAFLERHGFPRPETNFGLHGAEVDLYYPTLRLVIEVDSERYHGTRFARRNDAEKQSYLEALGERVMRVWDFQLERDDPLTVRRLRRTIAAREERSSA